MTFSILEEKNNELDETRNWLKRRDFSVMFVKVFILASPCTHTHVSVKRLRTMLALVIHSMAVLVLHSMVILMSHSMVVLMSHSLAPLVLHSMTVVMSIPSISMVSTSMLFPSVPMFQRLPGLILISTSSLRLSLLPQTSILFPILTGFIS